jgi:hypothetical protein
VSEFEQGMQEVMDNLEKAQLAFDDLSGDSVLQFLVWCKLLCWCVVENLGKVQLPWP